MGAVSALAIIVPGITASALLFFVPSFVGLALVEDCPTVLAAFVGFMCLLHTLQRGQVLSLLVGLLLGTFVCTILAVLFGAPAWHMMQRTVLFAAVLASLTAGPVAQTIGSDAQSWRRLLTTNSPNSREEVAVYYPAASAVIGSWFGAFPIPLDWDRPWQAWPVTCVSGAVLGYSVGCVLTSSFMLVMGEGTKGDKRK